jgi:stage V sporulation protein AD
MHAGGSGCGCAAAVFTGLLLQKLREKQYQNLLLVATGALMSPIISQQGESIPAIAHAVAVTS